MEIHRIADGKISVFLRNLRRAPVYYARFKITNRKVANDQRYVTESLATPVLEVALDRARQRYVEIAQFEKLGRAIRSNSVADEIDAFMGEYAQGVERKLTGFSAHMLRGFRKTIVRYVREFLGRKMLQDVSLNDMEKYEAWRQSYWERKTKNAVALHGNSRKRASRRTLEWEVNAFKRFLRWAHLRGKYAGNALDFTFRAGEDNRRSAFTSVQWTKLNGFLRRKSWTRVGRHKNDARLARYRRMLKTYVRFMAHTGVRIGEARNLRWRDIRFHDGPTDEAKSIRVTVAAAYSKVGKGREVVGGKTAYDALTNLRQERIASRDNCSPDDFIWCDTTGGLIQEFREGFNSLIAAAGVELDTQGQKLTVYSLRHTYITFRLREGVDIYQLASNCGTSVEMIEKYYSHARPDDFAKELTKRRPR
jgi:integrase